MTKFVLFAAALVSFNVFAESFAPLELTAKEEKALVKELKSISDSAAVGNGGTELKAYKASAEFDMEAALAGIAKERPDVYSEDGKDTLQQSFKTVIGRHEAIAYMKSEEFVMWESEKATVASIESLFERGLVRAILHRYTNEMITETYLIPDVFDIYVEYTRGGKLKGQLLRLSYESGD
jgi:hypothetical protein